MIDILLSTYNGSRFVREFVGSLGRQTCRDFRLLVRDDGSDDATVDAVREAAAEHGIREVVFSPSSGRHLGVAGSFGDLLAQSFGRDVMFADQDDVWHEDKVAEMVRLMREAEAQCGGEAPLLLHTDLRVCGEDGSIVADSFFRRQRFPRRAGTLVSLLVQNNVTGCATMINRALRERLRLPFPAEAICHDWYLALVAAAFGKIVFVDRPFVDYRVHDGNVFGAPGYAESCFGRLRRGSGALRHRLVLTQRQAGAFLRQYGDLLGAADRRAGAAWARIGELTKFRRLAACRAFGFRKNTAARNIGMWWAI